MTEKHALSTEDEEGQGASAEAGVDETVKNEGFTTPPVNEDVHEVKTPKTSTKRARTSGTPKKTSGNGSSSASSSPSKGASARGTSNSWTLDEKWTVLDGVIKAAHPNWEEIATQLGKSRSQVYDQWRKSLYPELKVKYGKGLL